MLIMLTVSYQIGTIPSTTLPKATVAFGPKGSPYLVPHPITINVPGVKATDSVTLPNGQLVSVYDDYVVVQTTSTYDQIIAGPVMVTEQVEPLKYYDVSTDANGYISIAHGLHRNPDKWLVTSSVGPSQEPVVLNFVSSDTNNLTLRAFSNNSPLVSSSIKISLLLN